MSIFLNSLPTISSAVTSGSAQLSLFGPMFDIAFVGAATEGAKTACYTYDVHAQLYEYYYFLFLLLDICTEEKIWTVVWAKKETEERWKSTTNTITTNALRGEVSSATNMVMSSLSLSFLPSGVNPLDRYYYWQKQVGSPPPLSPSLLWPAAGCFRLMFHGNPAKPSRTDGRTREVSKQ